MIGLKLLALCVLFRSGLGLGCAWDGSVEENQGLDPSSLTAGATQLGEARAVSDAESCRAACCADPRCELALVGLPADGPARCVMVTCEARGEDACVLQPSAQFRVYRKQRPARAQGPEVARVVPLLGSWEPRSNETNSVRCRLPLRVGPCRAAFPRFFYDVTNQSCRSFIYGGCNANDNNFSSQQECEDACRGVTGAVLPDESTPAPPQLPVKSPRMAPSGASGPSESGAPQRTEMSAEEFSDRCAAPPLAGPCRAAFPRWFFHTDSGTCRPFVFGGCRGNENNYEDEDSCRAQCTGVTVLPSSKNMDEDVSHDRARCLLTSDPGPCRAAFPMFHFDAQTESCQLFLYGGCRGNENRFESAEECMRVCSGDGWFDRRGRNRWTAAFFLFVTLASVSALLLAALVVVALRRSRLSRRAPPHSDKEELLPEEQNSVESLDVPDSPEVQQKA